MTLAPVQALVEIEYRGGRFHVVPDGPLSCLDTKTIFLDGKLTPGHLPEPTRDNCGIGAYKKVCRDHPEHGKVLVHDWCYQSGCPTCSDLWVTRASVKAAEQVRGYHGTHKGQSGPWPVVFSLKGYPRNKTGPEILAWLVDRLNRDIPRMEDGAVGGVRALALVVHPYRFRSKKLKKLAGAKARERNEGETDNVRPWNSYDWALRQENWDLFLVFSPHIHGLMFGRLKRSDIVYEETGWVYKVPARPGERAHPVRSKNLVRHLLYLLSHAWVKGNGKAVRYWRGISTRHLSYDSHVEFLYEKCKLCGGNLARVPWFWTGDPEEMKDHYLVVVVRDFWDRGANPGRVPIRLGVTKWEGEPEGKFHEDCIRQSAWQRGRERDLVKA